MISNFAEILFRVGIVLLVCGLLVGLAISQWTLIPIFGFILMVPNLVDRVLLYF